MSAHRRNISAGTLIETCCGTARYRGRPFQELPERARSLAEQRGQRVLGLLQARLELRDRGPRALEQRARLHHVELRGRAVVEARLRDAQAFLLHRDVPACQLDEDLERADRRVGPRDLRGKRDERVVVIGDRREETGLLGRHALPVSSPEVDFPRRVEPDLIVVVAARLERRHRELARLVRGEATDCGLELRVPLAVRVAQARTRFEDPEARDLQREILTIGEIDQSIERGIVERFPPLRIGSGRVARGLAVRSTRRPVD